MNGLRELTEREQIDDIAWQMAMYAMNHEITVRLKFLEDWLEQLSFLLRLAPPPIPYLGPDAWTETERLEAARDIIVAMAEYVQNGFVPSTFVLVNWSERLTHLVKSSSERLDEIRDFVLYGG